jgi:archaellum component FlaC
MREEIEKVIEALQNALDDLDKVDNGSYGYKSAAPRARKVLMEASKQIKDVRTQVQEVKKSHEQN